MCVCACVCLVEMRKGSNRAMDPTAKSPMISNKSADSPSTSSQPPDLEQKESTLPSMIDEQELTAEWFGRFLDILGEIQKTFQYPNRKPRTGDSKSPNVIPGDTNSTILVPRLVAKVVDTGDRFGSYSVKKIIIIFGGAGGGLYFFFIKSRWYRVFFSNAHKLNNTSALSIVFFSYKFFLLPAAVAGSSPAFLPPSKKKNKNRLV